MSAAAALCCAGDGRRAVVRAKGRTGFDYVEVDAAQTTLSVHFLGRAPDWDDARFLRLDGGRRIRDLVISRIGIARSDDDAVDDVMTVTVDRPGDFSPYRLCAVELDADGRPTGRPHPDFDPRYAGVDFGFKASCPSDLDCADAPACPPDVPDEPAIDYLAKDYASFRRLLLDRLALVMPDWTERHAPDLGVTLVEILAYVADELSYTQDAVATEAYLDTARLRTSIRRHVRLVDYTLGEGCNARALIAADVSEAALTLQASDFAVVTRVPGSDGPMLGAAALPAVEPTPWLTFEPCLAGASVTLRRARNTIDLYTWGDDRCCLPRGATTATLADPGRPPAPPLPPDHPDYCAPAVPPVDLAAGAAAGQWHELHLAPCDLLIFAEVIGPRTGEAADADPAKRHAVRLTRATPGWDPLFGTLVWEVEWCAEDALPFPLCLSAVSDAPKCKPLTGVSVAYGNVFVVDHGRGRDDDLGTVDEVDSRATCATACAAAEIVRLPGRFRPALPRSDLTFAVPLAPCPPADGCGGCGAAAATALAAPDATAAVPAIVVTSRPAQRPGAPPPPARQWTARGDLLASGPDDRHFVVEVDDDRVAWLRFGDGDCGCAVEAGEAFTARYRTGSGPAGNVGADTLTQIVFADAYPDGATITVRNPLPAAGGTAFEAVAEARLRAPHAFRTRLERAVVPADYAAIVRRDFPAQVQRAAAMVRATGVRMVIEVAVDSIGRTVAPPALLACIAGHLERYRRIGHDISVVAAEPVAIDLAVTVCVADGYLRGHVEAAVLAALGAGRLRDGSLGFFHPDRLTFGTPVTVSALVAAVQALAGVASVVVTRLERLFAGPNDELANGVLPLGPLEVARLDADPDFPEHGRLVVTMRGTMSGERTCGCGGATCGCCAGVAVTTPADPANRPGLDALATRIGTHGTFLASMQARLASHRLDSGARPLAALRTRRGDDPAIALLDAWATAADVLTFYQQRIANEGYLRTATERASLHWLARLIGYAPRPGVSASVYLSYALDKPPVPAPGAQPAPAETLIARGARAQTVPGQGELPQSFETSDDLVARAAWNRLGVRRSEPQQLRTVTAVRTLYLAGTQTRLKPGDPLLIGSGTFAAPIAGDPAPVAWRIVTVAEDAAASRTRVTLAPWGGDPAAPAVAVPHATAGGAGQGVPQKSLLATLAAAPSRPPADALLLRRDLAHNFDRSGDAALQVMTTATPRLGPTLGAALAGDTTASAPAGVRVFAPRLRAGLFGSRVPRRSGTRLTPVMNGEFSTGMYSSETVDIGEWPIVSAGALVDNQSHVSIRSLESAGQLWLDAAYDGVVADSWLLIDESAVPVVADVAGKRQVMVAPVQPVLVARAAAVQPKVSRAAYGLAADTTGLTLAAGTRWIRLIDSDADLDRLLTQATYDRDFQVIRNTTVYARSEELALAEAPVAGDLCGGSDPLELDGLYLDLAPGRFVVVSGERADLPGIDGVVASEAAMIADVVHDVAADLPDGHGGLRRLPLRRAEALAPFDDKSAVQPLPLAGDSTHSFVTLEKPLAYCYKRGTVQIHGNVVKATHGESRHELVGSGDGTRALQTFALKQSPVTWLAAPTPAGAASTLAVFVDDVRWTKADSFLDSGPRDRVYLERTDAAGVTSLVFGNGRAGARLPTGGAVVADYRQGIGRAGNVRAGQISQLATRPLGVREVVNPLPATGGADAEGSGDIRRNAPLAVMAFDRLVATRDYADFARTFAGIGKADAVRLSDGRAGVVHVTVAGSADAPLDDDDDLLVSLRRAFADFGDPFEPVRLAVRELLLLIVAAKVRIDPDRLWERVAVDVRAALLDAFGFDRRGLGQGAASSEVLGVIQSVAGVAYVDLDAFGAIPTLDFAGGTAVPRPPELIAADVAAVIAAGAAPKVDAARARPGPAGTLRPAQLLLLAPSVPATLVLNRID